MKRPREIITLQLGPFSNWAGSHFWNAQDDARHPVAIDASGDPVFDDEQADAAVLYRSSGPGRASQMTPRLIVCDTADAFGGLGSSGGLAASATPASAAASVDPLSWGGSVSEVVHEARAAHAFAQMMSAPLLGDAAYDLSDGYGTAARDAERYDDDDDDDGYDEYDANQEGGWRRALARRQRSPTAAAAAADERSPVEEEEEEELRAAAFDFEDSVTAWSDYLQAHLHSRSIAPLKPHVHGYSTLARFPDGACVVEREEDTMGGPVRASALPMPLGYRPRSCAALLCGPTPPPPSTPPEVLNASRSQPFMTLVAMSLPVWRRSSWRGCGASWKSVMRRRAFTCSAMPTVVSAASPVRYSPRFATTTHARHAWPLGSARSHAIATARAAARTSAPRP